jgi:hypothetical protein
MADFSKFTVVYTVGSTNGRSKFQKLDPYSGSVASIIRGHSILGVTMTECDEDDPEPIMRSGYMRDLTQHNITGWPPAEGALLWCDADASVTTIRPTTGLQVFVGTYIGSGVADVHVYAIPSIGDLSFVSRVAPAESYVLIWSEMAGAYVPRQITSDDFVDFDFSKAFMFLGD